jgi:hypothetical protein
MTNLISKFMGLKTGLKGLVAAGVLGLVPTAVMANPHDDFRADFRFGLHGPVVDVRPAPVYEDREVRVWVEPIYRTVVDQHVWVPDRYEYRDVVSYWHGFRHVHTERVLVEAGHYQDVTHQELMTPGHWETHIEHVRVR